MLSPLPRHSDWRYCFAHFAQSCQPSLIWPSGRPVHRPFRGLLGVHSRYGLHTRHVTVYRDAFVTEGFNCFVTSTAAPVASGWSIPPGGTLTHWKAPPFHGAPREPSFVSYVLFDLAINSHELGHLARLLVRAESHCDRLAIALRLVLTHLPLAFECRNLDFDSDNGFLLRFDVIRRSVS